MAKEWIEKLAQGIKHKDHDAAEAFAKEQRLTEVLKTKGRLFYDEFIKAVRNDLNELEAALKGDVTAVSTTLQNNGPNQFAISRARFPEITARILYDEIQGITLVNQSRPQAVTANFVFHVAEHDCLSVREAFGANAKHFDKPSELAKHVIEVLFSSGS